MIITSVSRKTIKAKEKRFAHAFEEKIHYANDFDHNHQKTQAQGVVRDAIRYLKKQRKTAEHVVLHNLYAVKDDHQMIAKEFLQNYEHFHAKKKNWVVVYHEVISFSPDNRKLLLQKPQIVMDIASKWLELRAPEAIGYGKIHFDKKHIHIHLIISGNLLGSEQQLRLKPYEFKKLQWQLELYKRKQYPELSIFDFYDPQRVRDRRKETVREQEMKRRQRNQGRKIGSRKEEISHIIQHCFDSLSVGSKADLVKELQQHGLEFFERGRKSVGVIDRTQPMKNGDFRKHRFESLGLFGEWQEVVEGWERERELEKMSREKRLGRGRVRN